MPKERILSAAVSSLQDNTLVSGSFTRPLLVPIFNRRPISLGAYGSLPYPDSQERRLLRQRIYNRVYYRRNRKKILQQKAEKRRTA